MRYIITADSTCDLSEELIKKYNIKIMPIIITMNDKEYQDGIDINQEKLYSFIETSGELPKTSARSSYEYTEFFENLLGEYDHIFHFSLSYKISSTGNNALIASQEIGNNKVTCFDTKSLSTGMGLSIISCAKKIKDGKSIEEITKEINEEIDKVQASFLIDTLKFLHKGGRCSGIALLGANLLKIKPRISLVDGEMKVTKKYMGAIEQSLIRYVNELLFECPPNKKRVFITYSSYMPVADKIEKILKDFGFEDVLQTYAGSTVCTHCGPKTLGILYVKE